MGEFIAYTTFYDWCFSYNCLQVLPTPVKGPWVDGDFMIHLGRWNVKTIYLESPGYIIYPPTRSGFKELIGRISECVDGALERFIIRCGYGREVAHADPVNDDDARDFQQLLGTPWEDRIEGVDDYYLPVVPSQGTLRNRRGGVYGIGIGEDRCWEEAVGSLPRGYDSWYHDRWVTFGF